MNEQQGKHFDKRIRQALDRLPDVPAPGSSFDANRLWEQLRPELATPLVVITPKRTGQVRWLVAASLVSIGLFLSWLLPTKFSMEEAKSDQRLAGYVVKKAPYQLKERARIEQETPAFLSETRKQPIDKQTLKRYEKIINPAVSTIDTIGSQLMVITINVPVDLPLSEAWLIEPALVRSALAVIDCGGAVYPKRRFAVVHQNELRAEAETQANLERNDRFVRWGGPLPGTSSTVPNTPADPKFGLIIPFN